VNFNYSAEKPIHNFTRFELYPDQDEQRPSEMDSYEVSYEVSKRREKNVKMASRYDFSISNFIGIMQNLRLDLKWKMI
jgi:hypothetical protein